MTGYRLEVGYLSGGNREDAWADLKAVGLAICEDPDRIVREVLRLEPTMSAVALTEYAQSYQDRVDLTVKFHEAGSASGACIYQMASGGDPGRTLKEACRRAFCRLVIEAMHAKRIEINMVVS